MPIARYGVLKGRPIDTLVGEGRDPHYQIRVVDETTEYRVAVNIKSQESPSDLEYLIDESFEHAVTEIVQGLSLGFHDLASRPGGAALDFIRSNLFHPKDMTKLPFGVVTPKRLDDQLDGWVKRALRDEKALLYAFGQRWGPEERKRDPYFGFLPGNGVHDVHMNQGNVGRFTKDDGAYQDGALLLQFPGETHDAPARFVAVFLKFQSQPWHTDDATGHAIANGDAGRPAAQAPPPPAGMDEAAEDHAVPDDAERMRIVAANVRTHGGAQSVTLLNGSPDAIDLTGWTLANAMKQKAPLPKATIEAGGTVRVPLPQDVPLSNKGGIITLLDPRGLKVNGVAYTRRQARGRGWSIPF